MSDDQAREMRPETTSEHIARDMREGRFPEQSERQMVPVLASLPHEVQVWRSMDALDHTGTWSTTRYPPEAVTYVPKSDAAAAVALMVERAVDALEGQPRRVEPLGGQSTSYIQLGEAVTAIRALAPADGLAAVEALRVEARENAMQALASMGQAQEAYEAQLEAEAELAVAQQREAGLVAAMEIIAKQKRTDELDTEHDVEMADFEGGYDAAINVARAALATQEAKNG